MIARSLTNDVLRAKCQPDHRKWLYGEMLQNEYYDRWRHHQAKIIRYSLWEHMDQVSTKSFKNSDNSKVLDFYIRLHTSCTTGRPLPHMAGIGIFLFIYQN